MTSSPDDTARDDTARDDTAPGTVPEPFVPSAKIAVPQLPRGVCGAPGAAGGS